MELESGAAALPNTNAPPPPPAIWRSTADDDSTLLDDLDHEPTVLKSYRDWDEWKRDIQPHVDVFIWRYMWSDRAADELRARPTPPQVQQFNRHARDVSELTKDEFDLYHDQNKAYYARKQEFDRQSDMVDRARALVLRTVAPAKAELLDAGRTLREWVALLRDTTAPTYRQRIEIERGNYSAVLERFDLGDGGGGGGGETDWAHEWYSAVTRCHKLGFPETLCGTWLRDLADCILPFSPPLFDRFMLGADRLDLAAMEWRAEAEEAMAFKKTHKCGGGGGDDPNSGTNGIDSSRSGHRQQQEAPSEIQTNEAMASSSSSSARPPVQAVPSEEKEVVELDAASPHDADRLWTFLEVYREIRDLEFGGSEADVAMDDDDDDDDGNADAASAKGSDSPQCPACNLRGHELRHCWYAFEERRPRGVMLSRSRMRRVERAIRTDKNLEQRVDDIYTAFTGGRFYQRQLMLGSTQSAW
ncbi:hypothetical protein BBK36DRAFT_1114125 [Trichoderma citrinoviride]|uniref:Uncharacterized protein n=1 Tax=Trichoderma citrinoviride TaxID=58853 RepID=A0A2T4BEL7_9HYPO|nr:hypothetical protein BBK36DRAFT_1114125 [Trichoderma citrinoviride]PTB67783.1 hypothetical protein BBK36DRAFT_1114125 [Trichoderma citrinoviride]